jgi:hypothetical protein
MISWVVCHRIETMRHDQECIKTDQFPIVIRAVALACAVEYEPAGASV